MWKQLCARSGETIKILKATGAQELSRRNFRDALALLGAPAAHNLEVLSHILDCWAVGLRDKYEQELQTKGLL